MTDRNVERTGSRNELALSNSVRKIPDVRHQDIDMMQYDPETLQTEVMVEATSSQRYTATHKTRLMRKQAKLCDSFALYVLHEVDDAKNQHPVRVVLWDNKGSLVKEFHNVDMTWDELNDLMYEIHVAYVIDGLSTSNQVAIKKGLTA